LEGLFVRLDSARMTVEHVAASLANPSPRTRALFVIQHQLGLGYEHPVQGLPVAEQRRQCLHAFDGLDVAGLEFVDVLVRFEGRSRIITWPVVDLGQLTPIVLSGHQPRSTLDDAYVYAS